MNLMNITSGRVPILKNRLIQRVLFVLLLSLPVVLFVFKFSILYRHGIFAGEDWDEFAQMYEAARRSILEFHQFPWWNPWSIGGEPLFANPQFGLISIQMPLVLLFGTNAGLHYSTLIYYLLGFWRMYLLIQRIGTGHRITSALLSYIWVFSGFEVWHLGFGHLTFATYFLAPWFFLALLNIDRRRGWLWFALVAAFLVNQAPHYLSIETLVIGLVIAAFMIIRRFVNALRAARQEIPRWRLLIQILRPFLMGGGLALLLSIPKLIYVFEFVHEFPRLTLMDAPVPLMLVWTSLLSRGAFDPGRLFWAQYGVVEYADYIGFGVLALFSYVVLRRLEDVRRIPAKYWALLVGIVMAFLTTLGPNRTLVDPYVWMHHLPIFNQMHVPSRWIGWVVFGMILALHQLPRKPVFYLLLGLCVLDVASATYPILNYRQSKFDSPTASRSTFEQYAGYKTEGGTDGFGSGTYRLLQATQQNLGEVYGYEPMFQFGAVGTKEVNGHLTDRCGVNQGCDFVMSHNADVKSWTPLRIVLERTGPGPIQLNMNPSKNWLVNGKVLHPDYRIVELHKSFEIDDSSYTLVLQFEPRL